MGVSPRMEITLDKAGEFGTTDFTMTFKKDGKTISPWHDIPLEAGDGMYNFVCEIPKMTLKKMEVATKVEGNPIMQDEKKGKARLYHGPIFWNYGCLPQTWEDPNINDVDDIEKYYPGTVSGIREWFRWYKTPDDKPINGFGHGEKALNAAKAVEVIKETNEFYLNLKSGKTDAGKLSLK